MSFINCESKVILKLCHKFGLFCMRLSFSLNYFILNGNGLLIINFKIVVNLSVYFQDNYVYCCYYYYFVIFDGVNHLVRFKFLENDHMF